MSWLGTSNIALSFPPLRKLLYSDVKPGGADNRSCAYKVLSLIIQLLFQQNALVLLKAQDITICTFCLCVLIPYMFQPAWAIFRGRNVSAWLNLLMITVH
jgi:hypothetical protein